MNKTQQRIFSNIENYKPPTDVKLTNTQLRSIHSVSKIKKLSKDEIKMQKVRALFKKWDNEKRPGISR